METVNTAVERAARIAEWEKQDYARWSQIDPSFIKRIETLSVLQNGNKQRPYHFPTLIP